MNRDSVVFWAHRQLESLGIHSIMVTNATDVPTGQKERLQKDDPLDTQLLKAIPCIGLLTAMTLLTEMETVERFENTDHFAAYIGLVPNRHNCGDVKKDGEMTPRGQSVLKKSIIESAWIAARRDPALSLAYNKYVQRIEANKAIIWIARKLLNRIYFVLKNRKEYVSCAP